VLWVFGTVFGACLGLLLMADARLAGSPYALAAILAAAAFAVGSLGSSRFRVGIVAYSVLLFAFVFGGERVIEGRFVVGGHILSPPSQHSHTSPTNPRR
jgi:hypothetical protein